MSVRHIEEVIGWKQDDDGNVPWSPVWTTPGGRVRFDGAQVDDLAAWLDAELGTCLWSIQRDTGGFLIYWDAGVLEGQTAEHPTILAALTAAVRKVAEQ